MTTDTYPGEPAHGQRLCRICGRRTSYGCGHTANGGGAYEPTDKEIARALETARGGLEDMRMVRRPEHWCGYVLVDAPRGGGLRVYPADAWEPPSEDPILPWSPPEGIPIAEVDMDGNLHMLDTESSASRQHYIDTGRYLRRGEAFQS